MAIKFLSHKIRNPQQPDRWIEMSYIDSDDDPTTDNSPTIHVRGKLVDFEAVNNDNLVDHTINYDKIALGGVHSVNLDTDAVIEEKILNGAVTQNKIGNLAVITDKLADGAVTASKIDWTTVAKVVAIPNETENRKLWINVPVS